MNKIPKFDAETENLHSDCLRDKILKGLRGVSVESYSAEAREQLRLQKYLDNVKEYISNRGCLIAGPEALAQIVNDVESKFFKWKKIPVDSSLGKLNKKLENIFGYSRFRDKRGRLNDTWGGEVLMRRLLKNVRYCPYCNAETVYAIEMDSVGRGRPPLIKAAFDHFYPKGRYPFLSVSLYNLIPSCYRCNSQFKIDHYKKLVQTLHPYRDSVDAVMRFIPGNIPMSVWNGEEDDSGFKILFEPKEGTSAEYALRGRNFDELFQISRVYSKLYRTEAIAMLQKCRVFDEEYMKQVEGWFRSAGLGRVNVKQLVFNVPDESQAINSHRHMKMLIDMRKFWQE